MDTLKLLDLLKRADQLIGDMMPGVRYIALQDYKALNDVPLDIQAAIRELTPHPRYNVETATGDDLDYHLFGVKRPAGMSDYELRNILRDRSFAEIIKSIHEWRPAHFGATRGTCPCTECVAYRERQVENRG
jgi:hypothetical protein